MLYKKILLLTLFWMLTGCNIVNQIRMKNANDHLVATWPERQTEAQLKTQYLGEKPFIEVTINGIRGFKFMIDTGASLTYVIDSEKVKALKLTPGYSLKIGGWGDEEKSQAFQTKVDTLSLGGVLFKQVNLSYLPVTSSKYFLDPSEAVYDGIIGHDILHHFSWIFNKKTNQISISSLPFEINLPVETSQRYNTFDFDTFFSKIDIEGTLDFGNGQVFSHEMIIDTGSRHHLKIPVAFIEGKDIKLLGPSVTAVDFGLSGRTVHQRISLPQLTLGELSLPSVKANLIGGDFEDDYSVIGSALLNQFISVIDYHSDKLHLLPYPDKPFKSKYNLLGLELRKLVSGNFIVRYVSPDLAAGNTDLQEGDIIYRINEKESAHISQSQWLEMTDQNGNFNICRKRDTDKCLKLTSSHIPGFSIKEVSK